MRQQEEMILIPAGDFQMGGFDSGCAAAELPLHVVSIDAFLMDATPVTNREFASFVSQTGYKTLSELSGSVDTWRTYATEDREAHPVVLVSWDDANEFARFAGKRLSTEAEWEKAARGGRADSLYPWGNEEPADNVCWQGAKAGVVIPATSEVASFQANGYGLYDMAGNVWEWCGDWYDDHYYGSSPFNNPQGPDSAENKVRRGGAWNVRESFRLRCSNRGAMVPSQAWKNLGFRCAKSV